MKAKNREILNQVLGLLCASHKYEDGEVCDIMSQSIELIHCVLEDEEKEDKKQ